MLVVPGWALITLINVRHGLFLFCVPLSLLVYILCMVVAREWSLTVNQFLGIYGSVSVILVLLALARLRKKLSESGYREWFESPWYFNPYLIITVVYGAYHLIFGMYTEIPGDMYRHLEFTKEQLNYFNRGTVGRELGLSALLVHQQGRFWQSLFALNTYLTSNGLMDTFIQAMWINGLLFCLGIFAFARKLFEIEGNAGTTAIIIALAAAGFTFMHMGIHAFSYVRYYSLAPSMLNFLGYFGGVMCVLHLMYRQGDVFKNLLLLLICMFVTAVVHTQEAMFIMVTACLVFLWLCIRKIMLNFAQGFIAYRGWLFGLMGFLVISAIVFIAAHLNLEFRTPLFNKVIALQYTVPVLGHPWILNPTYQFVHVMTYWGGFVYLLFLLNIRHFLDRPFLFAGMLSPILTVFNPLFVDLFLRADNATTLWRLCYIVPLHFTAAWLLIHYCSQIRSSNAVKKIWSGIAIAGLIVLLLPAFGPLQTNPYARTTLASIPKENSHYHWQDMLAYLNSLDKRHKILVDPISGYVISALTPHRTFRHKFIRNAAYHHNTFVFDSYDDFPLSKYKGWLMIVNLREGGHSVSGERARHWPAHVMQTSLFYPDNLLPHLQSNPERFELLWQADQIQIYKIIK